MPDLQLNFLGHFQVAKPDNLAIAFRSDKDRALLAYLAVESNRPHRREELAGLFWPDLPEESALGNLRKALHHIRQLTEAGDPASTPWQVSTKTIQLNSSTALTLDVAEFLMALDAIQKHRHRQVTRCLTCHAWLKTALQLYQGDFLQGFSIADSLAFEEWVLIKREQLRLRALDAFHQLTEQFIQLGELEAARQAAQRQVNLEPWHEGAHRQLMRLLSQLGQRAAALAQYEKCKQLLLTELGIEPEPATVALAEKIRRGDSVATTTPVRHNLPPQMLPFFGRETELRRITERLLDPAERLISIVGEGGVGKTRLALAAAQTVQPDFTDGVWFVPLAGLTEDSSAEAILQALASALQFAATGSGDLRSQLFDFMKPKECLVFFDNMELLTDAATVVMEILAAAPHTVVLVTSRQPLNFQAERVIRVDGLPVPAAPAAAEKFSSVQLFAERAQRAIDTFDLATELPTVIDICQMVGGSPLGIELAAAGVRQRSPKLIAEALRSNLDTLTTTMRDVPVRHRSMRAVFEASWELLIPPERESLARLAVFLGGFTTEAAQAVAAGFPSILSALVAKSLVRQVDPDRYDLHELLRQFASGKLNHSELRALREQHSHYYLNQAAALRPLLNGSDPNTVRLTLQADVDNLREAWRAAIVHNWWSVVALGWRGLADYYNISGYYHEALRVYQAAIDQLLSVMDTVEIPSGRYLLAALQVTLTRFLGLLYRLDQANESGRQAVARAQVAHAPELEALAKCYWGMSLYRQSNYSEATPLIRDALRLARASESIEAETMALRALGYLADIQGQYAEAQRIQLQVLELYRQSQSIQGECLVLVSLGNIAWSQGDLAAAQHYHSESLRLARQIGNRNDECDALHNLGSNANSMGDYETARIYFEQSIAIGEQIGLPPSSFGITAVNLALVYHHLEQNAQAAHYAQQALTALSEAGQRRDEALALTVLGHALCGLGDYERAGVAYEKAVSIQRDLNQPNVAMEGLAGLARVVLQQTNPGRALQLVEEMLRHLTTGTLEGTDEPFRVYLTCYEVLKAGRDPRAQPLLKSTYEILQSRADLITDPVLRHSFLTNVAAHQKIVTAWQSKR